LKLVLMGESKRAWTAWLAASTGDPRIIGIVSTVFNNLNMAKQLAHQRDLWESVSPELHDYSDLGLPERVNSVEGRRLVAMVDPMSYLCQLKARTLLVHGSNDAYWAPDALSLYSACLPMGTGLLTLPNEGHVFPDKTAYYETAGAFARACATNTNWPYLEGKLVERNKIFVKLIISEHPGAVIRDCRLFVAESEVGSFSEAAWEAHGEPSKLPEGEARFLLPGTKAAFQAAFVQVKLELELSGVRSEITLSTPTVLRRKDSPAQSRS
jgi:PhoPQ-activated pathogenicity-related protein